MTKKLFYSVCVALGLNANAQELNVVKNIHPTGDSYAHGYTLLPNGKFVFSANDGVNGQELWISDGTNSGTELLKDINLGIDDSGPWNFILFQGKIFFTATTNDEGRELWVTDGTTAGTQMVKDINLGAGNSSINNFIIFQDKLYFSADNGVNGEELWVSDGTQAGTQMLKDINPGLSYGQPKDFITFQNKLFFRASTDTEGEELWVSDGTQAGTQMLKDINPGASHGEPKNFTIFQNKLFFSATTDTEGEELWVTDGTTAGTNLFYDIDPGSGNSEPTNLIVYNNKLYFTAYNYSYGRELWVTDGTVENTRMLKDINIGYLDSDPGFFIEFNGKLFFSANNGLERTLFQTDGTTFGTVQMFEDLGFLSHDVQPIVKLKDKLYYLDIELPGFNAVIKYTNGTYNHQRDIIDMVGVIPNYGLNFIYFIDGLNLIVNDSIMYLTGNYSTMGYELYKITDVAYASLENLETDEAFTIFPNPTSSVINITLKDSKNKQLVKIIDVAGVEVFSNEYNTNENNILIDVNNLSSGVYFVKINDTIGQKFIKK